jgi:hypothetical protein
VQEGLIVLDRIGDYARLQGERLAAWFNPASVTPELPGQPLVFHHIAKTGGTSLIRGLRAVTPARLCLTEHGNLSRAFVDDLVVRGLLSRQFIFGHPLTGAVLPLLGRARIVTILRDPCEQAISNYFWLRADRHVADHRAARQMGFREFLVSHPYFAIFQTASLHVGIQERPIARAEDLIERLPAIIAYLESMQAVAIPAMANRLYGKLVAAMDFPAAPKLPYRRLSAVSPAQRAELHEQFLSLQNHPSLAPLLAAEQFVYEKACSLANQNL